MIMHDQTMSLLHFPEQIRLKDGKDTWIQKGYPLHVLKAVQAQRYAREQLIEIIFTYMYVIVTINQSIHTLSLFLQRSYSSVNLSESIQSRRQCGHKGTSTLATKTAIILSAWLFIKLSVKPG